MYPWIFNHSCDEKITTSNALILPLFCYMCMPLVNFEEEKNKIISS
jgi:hypothetical protein